MFAAREGLKPLLEHEAPLVVSQLPDFFFARRFRESEAALALSELLTLRNGLSHDRIKAMRTAEFRALCDQGYALLCAALEAAEFLLDFELTFFSRIEVDKRRRSPPEFVHRFKRISGVSGDFFGGKARFPETRDSSAIMLVNRDAPLAPPLSLEPLYVYEEEAGEAPDIYYYNGMSRPERAEFAPCNHRGLFRAEESSRCDVLVEELALFQSLFAAPPSALGTGA